MLDSVFRGRQGELGSPMAPGALHPWEALKAQGAEHLGSWRGVWAPRHGLGFVLLAAEARGGS